MDGLADEDLQAYSLLDQADGSRTGTADTRAWGGHSSPAADRVDLQCSDRQPHYSLTLLPTKPAPYKDIRIKALILTHLHVNEAEFVLSDTRD